MSGRGREAALGRAAGPEPRTLSADTMRSRSAGARLFEESRERTDTPVDSMFDIAAVGCRAVGEARERAVTPRMGEKGWQRGGCGPLAARGSSRNRPAAFPIPGSLRGVLWGEFVVKINCTI